jgi:pyruvate,water dikinase
MTTATIRRLRDVGLTDVADVGGKAASLGDLLAAGVRVPDGVVLTDGAGGMTRAARQSLLGAASADLGAGPFAVRSSGIAEDGAEHSFAGVFETVLDVSAVDIPAATERVLESARAARASAYGIHDAPGKYLCHSAFIRNPLKGRI